MFLMALKAPGEEEVGQNRPPLTGVGGRLCPSLHPLGPQPIACIPLCFPWASMVMLADTPWEGTEQV